jgi:CYTH domain-containing protein
VKLMAREIERKFPVTGAGWRAGKARDYRPGYLSIDKQRTAHHQLVTGIAQRCVNLQAL